MELSSKMVIHALEILNLVIYRTIFCGEVEFCLPVSYLMSINVMLCLLQNTIIDERGSFAVTSPFPGSLANILKSMEKVGDELLFAYFLLY